MLDYNILLTNDTVVIFDEGYLFHYRYYATMRNLKFRFKDEPPTENDIVEAFSKHLRQQLDKIKKKFKTNLFIFAIDGSCKDVWRNELFKEYKMTRTVECRIPDRVWNTFSEIIKEYGVNIAHKNLESDDIAALCVRALNQDNKKKMKIIIITGDNDFLQLKKYKNVSLYKGNLSESEGSGDPTADMMMKIVAGDPSDNIKGLCGKVKAKKLIQNKKEFEDFLEKDGMRERFTQNKTLVDFDCIPEKFVTEFNCHVNFTF